MSLNSLRLSRLERLHTDFLDASKKYKNIFYVAILNEDPELEDLLIPFPFCHDFARHTPKDHKVVLEECWDEIILSSSRFMWHSHGTFYCDPQPMRWNSKIWWGQFISPYFIKGKNDHLFQAISVLETQLFPGTGN